MLAAAVINVFGLEFSPTIIHPLDVCRLTVVSFVSLIEVIIILAPFMVQMILVFVNGDFQLSKFLVQPKDPDWGLFLSTILWAYSGWDGLGSFAGEVKDPTRTYPRGIPECHKHSFET